MIFISRYLDSFTSMTISNVLLTFRIISDQRWFLLNNLIVLFIFEWLDANWSCIFCMNDNQFNLSIMINSIACRSLSNRSDERRIWFCCFWRSFFLSNTSSIFLINESAFSFDFSNRYVITKWKFARNWAHLFWRRFNSFLIIKYFRFL
jgi:hypothetical protein